MSGRGHTDAQADRDGWLQQELVLGWEGGPITVSAQTGHLGELPTSMGHSVNAEPTLKSSMYCWLIRIPRRLGNVTL